MLRVETRLSEEGKQAWIELYQRQGYKEAAMSRMMIQRVTGGQVPAKRVEYKSGRSKQIKIRLGGESLGALVSNGAISP